MLLNYWRQRNRPLEKKAGGRRARKEAADAEPGAAATAGGGGSVGTRSKNVEGLANVENPWRCLCFGSRLCMITNGIEGTQRGLRDNYLHTTNNTPLRRTNEHCRSKKMRSFMK